MFKKKIIKEKNKIKMYKLFYYSFSIHSNRFFKSFGNTFGLSGIL